MPRNHDGDARDPRPTERAPQTSAVIPAGAIRYLPLAGVGVLIFMNTKYQDVIDADAKEAESLGANGTPAFFVSRGFERRAAGT